MKYVNMAITILCSLLIILSMIYIYYVKNGGGVGPLKIKKVVVNQVYITTNHPPTDKLGPPLEETEHYKQKDISGKRGETLTFVADVIQRNGPPPRLPNQQPIPAMMRPSNLPVTWTVTGGTASSIDERGLLTIGKLETSKKLVVTATSSHMMDTSKKKKSGKVTVTVNNPLDNIHIGPGGGIVFYDKGEFKDGWRYLEVAPVKNEFLATWGLYDVACVGTSEGLGTGKANTEAILKLHKTFSETGKAAQLCASLSINGLNDWYLPSKDELNEMYLFYKNDKDDLADFKGKTYWSSSAYSGDTIFGTWYQRFDTGKQEYSKIAVIYDVVTPAYDVNSSERPQRPGNARDFMMYEDDTPIAPPRDPNQPPTRQSSRGIDRKYTGLSVRAIRAF